ncbi:hypothetical protein BGZ63DRAFT_390744 [Mariannaea sp. PMI_226]|nr:hypothetical protein BGZ63DRAFT_390744 [Mariannaea sp. PMI_226]
MRTVTGTLLRARLTSHINRAATRTQTRRFSNPRALLLQNKLNTEKKGNESQPDQLNIENPSYPAFSFEALGLSRNMKVFLIIILSIFGTLETWFYCKAIWQWWKGGSNREEA